MRHVGWVVTMGGYDGWLRERERWPLAKVDGRLCTATPTLAARPAAPPSQSQTKPRESADALQQQPHHLLIVVDRVGVEEEHLLSGIKDQWVLQRMAGPKEIQVEETGPDFVIQNMEKILTKSRSAN